MANESRTLTAAKRAKKDEFYTQLSDIENELRHYRRHFRGKVVLCNCDDPFESNFFKYFALNFNKLGLKRLVATCYAGSPIVGKQLSLFDVLEGDVEPGTPYKAVVNAVYDATGDGYVDMDDVERLFELGENELSVLEGDGDFRSPECLALLDEADIVATNPPFSLFREYVSTLVEHGKKFVVIGNQNAIKYKNVFTLFMNDEIWLGYKFGDMAFKVPEHYEARETRFWVDDTGQKWRSLGNACWFTNLDHKRRHEELVLWKRYDPALYPRYANFDAIEVSKVADIPCDYAGLMGVPITFMDKYNPEQFELVGANFTVLADAALSDDIRRNHRTARRLNFYLPVPDGAGNNYTRMYDRLVIRNRNPEPPKEA